MRTYGQYRHVPADASPNRRAFWLVTAEPHVMVKLKRTFPRVLQARTSAIAVADTADVARDLEWFCGRYPLIAADPESGERLAKQAEGHRAAEDQVLRILGGERVDHGWREPAIPAREYQLVAADLVRATGRLLLTDDLGLGKTLSGMLVLRDPQALPAVVVTETHLTTQWERELGRFLPWLTVHVVTSSKPYDPTQLMIGRGKNRRPVVDRTPDVLVMSYSKLAGWADHLANRARTVIYDEMQALRHRDTNRYIGAQVLAGQATYRVGLTNTPVYNYGDEIHSVVEILDPEILGSREEFKREWCSADDDGGRRGAKVRNPAALGAYLRDAGIMLRRTGKDVGRELPPVVVVEQNVDIDPFVLETLSGDATGMAELILNQETGHADRWRMSGELENRMRHATGVAKAPFVAEFVRLLLEAEDRVVVWVWHREVYRLLTDRLQEFHPVLYSGSESPAQKDANAAAFKTGESRVLLMSLRSGAGLDGLQDVCRVGVFAELDWSPQVHKQAIGRLNRDGQPDTVVAYYLVSDQGADPAIAEVLDIKRQQSEPILDPDGDLFTVREDQTVGRAVLLAREVLNRRRPVSGIR